ncbi:MAG: QueT transporter family protein [Oscillospiraceae bacterium]|nr:QueT transporter family protein [Oscillospiraceae bacterium]
MNARKITFGGILAALYVVLTYGQNLLWPGSTTMAIQMRMSEVLCIFAFFTPAAIPGLTLGCLLYNVSWAQALPLDWLVGSLATLLATVAMWKLRKVRLGKIPVAGLLMPALFNAPLVGWELAVYLGEGGFTWPVFGLNALYVFLGEAIVLLVPGMALYGAMTARGLEKRLFPA